jgi:hypothetical protein
MFPNLTVTLILYIYILYYRSGFRVTSGLYLQVPHVEQKIPTVPEHMGSSPILVRFVLLDLSYLYFLYFFSRSLFVHFSFWSFYCLFLFDWWLLVSLISSNCPYLSLPHINVLPLSATYYLLTSLYHLLTSYLSLPPINFLPLSTTY